MDGRLLRIPQLLVQDLAESMVSPLMARCRMILLVRPMFVFTF